MTANRLTPAPLVEAVALAILIGVVLPGCLRAWPVLDDADAAPPGLARPPTREQLMRAKVSMYGTACSIPELGGLIPWWDPGIMTLSRDGREIAYACKHAAGDTAVILAPGERDGILYDEPGNPYRIPIHPFSIAERTVEAVQHGFWVKLILDGDGEQSQKAFDQFSRVLASLSHGGPSGEDLHHYVEFVPGWDGVFQGCAQHPQCWTPERIQQWAAMARRLCPDCVLGLEFNTGHIPFGNGESDYRSGGGMQNFDSLLVEFDFDLHNDNTWQVLAPLLGPAYVKPADDPNPSAPWYLAHPTSRGPWGVECFEPPTYRWVRAGVPVPRAAIEEAAANRKYLLALGCPVVD